MDENIEKQFHRWLVGKKSVQLSTAKTYSNQVVMFEKKYNIDSATNADVVKYFADLRIIEQKNANTRRLRKTGLEQFFEFYAPIARIPNPMKGLEPIKKHRAFPKLVNPDEVERMCFYENKKGTEFAKRNSAIIALFAMTGMRVGEFERLKLGNVEPQKDHFTVLIPAQKGTYDRPVQFGKFIPGTIVDYFTRYWLWIKTQKHQKKTNPLFFKIDFRHLHQEDLSAPVLRGSVDYLLRRAAYNAGIDRRITVHQLRHFYATHSIINGMNLFVLQRNLGHARIETTQEYVHIAGLISDDSLKHNATANIKSSPELPGYTELMRDLNK